MKLISPLACIQAAAAAAEREEAQEQANPHVSKSPQTGVEHAIQAKQTRSPVPRIWQSAQAVLPETPVRRSTFFLADPKQASLTSEHEAALISQRDSAEQSGSLGANAVVTTTFIAPSSGAEDHSSLHTSAGVAETPPGSAAAPVQDGTNSNSADSSTSHKLAGSAGSRGGKRDVRGVFRAHKPNSKSPAAHAAVRQSLYTPVKLRDMTQLGRHPSSTKGISPCLWIGA